jgi:hypothetical protein
MPITINSHFTKERTLLLIMSELTHNIKYLFTKNYKCDIKFDAIRVRSLIDWFKINLLSVIRLIFFCKRDRYDRDSAAVIIHVDIPFSHSSQFNKTVINSQYKILIYEKLLHPNTHNLLSSFFFFIFMVISYSKIPFSTFHFKTDIYTF